MRETFADNLVAVAPGSAARPELVRRLNRRGIVEALRADGPMTKAELARRAGTSYPTVLKVVAELTAEGLLEEGNVVQPAMGRPGKALGLARKRAGVASVVLGVERCTVAGARLDGTLLPNAEIGFPAPPDYESLLEELARALAMLSKSIRGRLVGVGVSVPGVIEQETGRVVVSPNLPFLNGRSLVRDVEALTGIPVAVVRSMQAHYLAAAYGKGRIGEDFLVVNFAGGIGMAACSGGRFIDGGGGMSGELGHLTVEPGGKLCGCGKRGCLETVASDRAVMEAASERHGRKLEMDEVRVLSRSGELDIADVLHHAADMLAVGIASAIHLLNPRRVLLYGHFMEVRDDLFERFLFAVRGRTMAPLFEQVEIFPPDSGAHASQQIGAAAAVIDQLVAGRTLEESEVAA